MGAAVQVENRQGRLRKTELSDSPDLLRQGKVSVRLCSSKLPASRAAHPPRPSRIAVNLLPHRLTDFTAHAIAFAEKRFSDPPRAFLEIRSKTPEARAGHPLAQPPLCRDQEQSEPPRREVCRFQI